MIIPTLVGSISKNIDLKFFTMFTINCLNHHLTFHHPKIIHPHMDLELFQASLGIFCLDHCIFHQNNACTSLENNIIKRIIGIVDSKHRHLLDMTHALTEMNVSLYLRLDPFMIATHIHKSLHFHLVVQFLCIDSNLFSILAHVFGCSIFVHDHIASLSKTHSLCSYGSACLQLLLFILCGLQANHIFRSHLRSLK